MKQVIFVLAMALVAFKAYPQEGPDSQREKPVQAGHHYTVTINNTCRQSIKVAAHFVNDSGEWVTRGWWDVPGNSRLKTDISSPHNQFYMFGRTSWGRQWPPEDSGKAYLRFPIQNDRDFLFKEGETPAASEAVETDPFSLKEISRESGGLSARFDC